VTLRRAIFLILTTIAGVMLYNAVAIYRFSQQDQTQSADCAIVAGAGVEGESPSPVFKSRLDHAINLYQQGLIHALVLTGGYSPGAKMSDAAIARQYVIGKNVPSDAIFIEEISTVTRENMRYAKNIMTQRQLHSALLVSDPLHMLRLTKIAEDHGIESRSSPTPSTRYRSWQAQARFLLRETFYYSSYRIWRLMPVQIDSIRT